MLHQGVFSIYKPVGMTSHDMVNCVRRATKVKRVGHGGTLDPLAEGVLVIAVGRENTKKLDIYVKGDKEYIATLMLGYISETDDKEGPIHEYKQSIDTGDKLNTKTTPTTKEVTECIKKFIGDILQTPSQYSAIKVNGKEAYKRIRKGEDFKMEKRLVVIKNIEIVSYSYPKLELKVECGTGVYIRSLARDIGESLHTGAYITRLVRTRVAEFNLDQTVKLEELKSKI
ncbi:MAG: tRNA pseudouridine(55) synthase TruB [Candidatus Levybacteria bacterium]|nr:tRNA pseudouridine(55) synthase TruB [Candidatus Levybacteria bacterium]MBP9814995.1 tRNA pseudouridine(55) synthase TruB [Candidatus Levybacteria bacterium]